MSSARRRRRIKLIGIVVSNGVPLLGVVVLGWNAAVLLLLYWLEFGSAVVWVLFRALFAGRPSEVEDRFLLVGAIGSKQGAIPLPLTNVSIRLSSLPIICLATPILTVLWILVGAFTVGLAGANSLDSGVGATVVLGAFGIFLSHGVTTGVNYFGGGEYHDNSAQTAIQGVFIQLIAIFFGVLFALPFVFETFGEDVALGVPLLAGVVFVKFAFDLVTHYRDRLVAFDERIGGVFGWVYDPPASPSIDPLTTVERRVRPSRRGLALGGIANTSRYAGTVYIGIFSLCLGVLAALAGVPAVAVLFALISVLFPIVAAIIDYWIRYGWMEYRVANGSILGYDRVAGSSQWRVDTGDVRRLHVERSRVDAHLDTETVIMELADRELRVPHLEDPGPVLDAFDHHPGRPGEDPRS